jgi:hypothetical protein
MEKVTNNLVFFTASTIVSNEDANAQVLSHDMELSDKFPCSDAYYG